MDAELKTYALSCPKCGAGLNVGESVETFACSYCGSTVRVEHGGGIVSLRLIGEEVRRVREGTDRTAAELAIIRLTKELDVLDEEAASCKHALESCASSRDGYRIRSWNDVPAIVGTFGVIAIFVLWVAFQSGWGWLISVAWILCGLVALGAVVLFVLQQNQWDEARQMADDLEAKIPKYSALLDAKVAQVAAVRKKLQAQRVIADRGA